MLLKVIFIIATCRREIIFKKKIWETQGRIGFNTACEAVVQTGLTWCLVQGGIVLFDLADPDRTELTDYPMTMFGLIGVIILSTLIFQNLQNSAVPVNAQSVKSSDDS